MLNWRGRWGEPQGTHGVAISRHSVARLVLLLCHLIFTCFNAVRTEEGNRVRAGAEQKMYLTLNALPCGRDQNTDCEHAEAGRQGGKQWMWGKGRKEPGNMGKGESRRIGRAARLEGST